MIYWAGAISSYAFTYSAPTIIHNLGYTSIQAQLLTVPVYVVATISTLLFSWLSDRHQTRWPCILIPLSIAACAFIALLAIPHPQYPGLTYGVLFAIPAGVNPPIIGIISWVGNNLSPTWTRSVGMVSLWLHYKRSELRRILTVIVGIGHQYRQFRRCHWLQHLFARAGAQIPAWVRFQFWGPDSRNHCDADAAFCLRGA
jgi:MFS family permease